MTGPLEEGPGGRPSPLSWAPKTESCWLARLYGFAGYGAMAPLFGAFHESGSYPGSPAGKSAGSGEDVALAPHLN